MKNLTSIIIILFLFVCLPVNSQQNSELPNTKKIHLMFDNFQIDTTLTNSLNKFDLSTENKKILINKVKSFYNYYLQSEWAVKEKPLEDNFTFLELNADGKPDLIFQGWSGGEPECIKIHFSNSSGFDSPIIFFQNLKDIKIANGKIKSLTSINLGCCAEYIEQESTYEFDKELNSKLAINRSRIRALPNKYEILNSPIKFTIKNEVYKLRGEPIIDDNGTFIYDYPEQGNTIAIFKKGSKGKAWAKDNSDPEREWWYVEMEPIQTPLEFDMFNYIDNKNKLRRMGWMSSRFLIKIE
tara:strand:- start:2410 stop:3300 length:891 start_codon:yes stop_codon:yes gene_type:complete